jgi:NAD-dependent deacetylase
VPTRNGVWDWYASRREMMKDVRPNAGHHGAWPNTSSGTPAGSRVITQNVDGLHQAAGSVGTLSLHGNIFDDIWLDPCMGAPGHGGVCAVSRAQPGRPPTCADCGNAAAPWAWCGSVKCCLRQHSLRRRMPPRPVT